MNNNTSYSLIRSFLHDVARFARKFGTKCLSLVVSVIVRNLLLFVASVSLGHRLWDMIGGLGLWLKLRVVMTSSLRLLILEHDQYTFAFLWNQASDDFLGDILRRIIEELLQLET